MTKNEIETAESTENDLDSIAPVSLRGRAAGLPLTASHAAVLPEALVWRKDVYSGTPDDEPAPVKEIWPGFECRACGATSEVAYEPAPGFEGDVPSRYDTIQFVWEGRRPVCNRCGSGLSDQRIDQQRPPRWQQPIIGLLVGVPRLSETHGPLMEAFEYDPVAFVRAEMDDLLAIEGIGQTFARKIVVKNTLSLATSRRVQPPTGPNSMPKRNGRRDSHELGRAASGDRRSAHYRTGTIRVGERE